MAQNGNTMYLFVALLATTPGNIISYIICGWYNNLQSLRSILVFADSHLSRHIFIYIRLSISPITNIERTEYYICDTVLSIRST
jgi:hypothetical protein